MKKRNISQYTLTEKYNISTETLYRLRHGHRISIGKLDELCNILDCEVEDIIKHIKDDHIKDEKP